ncbi:MAG: DUF2723 domain-containing protein, partial [Armatimonadetes bacterium]|nr:DUF2723 domain-containing protein [Armatimonadota bacterium]
MARNDSSSAAVPPEKLVGGAVFLVCLAVYLRTVCHSIPFGDGGELGGAAYTLGITHPSGYPIFTLLTFALTHLLDIVPGAPIYKANLVGVLYTA